MASKAVLELRPTNFAGLMDALKEVNRVMFSPERFLKVFRWTSRPWRSGPMSIATLCATRLNRKRSRPTFVIQ